MFPRGSTGHGIVSAKELGGNGSTHIQRRSAYSLQGEFHAVFAGETFESAIVGADVSMVMKEMQRGLHQAHRLDAAHTIRIQLIERA